MKQTPPIILIAASCCLSALLLFAQLQPQTSQILMSMGVNAKKVTQYQWKQRITVVRHGTPTEPIIDQITFDAGGQMQRTMISAPAPKEMSGIRGRIAANVKQNVTEMMELAGRYNKPQEMAGAIKKAQVIPAANTLQLKTEAVIVPDDSMTFNLDPETHLSRHIDIQTQYEGGPMTISQDYGAIPDGPNVMKRMKVQAPKKDLVVNVESYDFVRKN